MNEERVARRIAVAYDDAAQSPLELLEAIGEDYEVVWVVDMANRQDSLWNRLLPRLGPVVDTGHRKLSEVADDLRHMSIAGVIAFSDSQLSVASELAAMLELPGNPPFVTERLCDKWVQRQRLAAQGIDTPRVIHLAAGLRREELQREIESIARPFVIKPCRGSSSANTYRSGDSGILDEDLAALFGDDAELGFDYVAEEWLGDPDSLDDRPFADYVSVEAVAQGGVVIPVAITGKFSLAAPCRETGNFMPHHLGAIDAEAVIELAVAAAEALEVQVGALHIEIKLTREGPRVIEVNGRVGGGGIASLYSNSGGGSLIELSVAASLGAVHRPVQILGSRGAHPFAYAYFVQAPQAAETLLSLQGLDQLNELAGVIDVKVRRNVGDHLDWREGSQGYLLSVVGAAEDLDELAAVPGRVDAALTIAYG